MQATQWKVLVILLIGGVIAYILIKGLTIQPITPVVQTPTQPNTSTPTTPTYQTSGYEYTAY